MPGNTQMVSFSIGLSHNVRQPALRESKRSTHRASGLTTICAVRHELERQGFSRDRKTLLPDLTRKGRSLIVSTSFDIMSSTTLIIIVIVGLAFALFGVLFANTSSKGSTDFPYVKNATLFSPAERSFFGVLEQAVPEEYRVFGKVRVADVVSVRKLGDKRRWTRAFNQISAKHFDYVICRKDTLAVACVVELDDKSHQQRKRKSRDLFLASVCKAASLPMYRIPAQESYSTREIREGLLAMLMPQDEARDDGKGRAAMPGTMLQPTSAKSPKSAIVRLK